MLAPHFGLEKKPFPLLPTGAEVFVSPQAATLINEIRAACADQDAILTVSGARGVGKTTLVKRALSATGLRRQTVTIDGEPLKAAEVLESLLLLFGFTELPASKDAQLAAWRQKLDELKAADIHVFIVIENAQATGLDVIEELAALSAAAGETSAGARMVIMGDENLGDMIEGSELAELQQRISLAHTVLPLTEAELRGYLKHSVRAAGGEFDVIFEEDCVALLLQLSEGIPRIVNAIVTTVMDAAAAQGLKQVTAKLTADVAAKSYDSAADRFEFKPEVTQDDVPQAANDDNPGSTDENHVSSPLPDLDALARAIARAQGDTRVTTDEFNGDTGSASWAAGPLLLSDTARERTITCGMDSAGEFGMAADEATTTMVEEAEDQEEVRQRLSEARTLDDVDDAMAETLFGEELNQCASIVANKKKAASNDR